MLEAKIETKIEEALKEFVSTKEDERYKFLIQKGRLLPEMTSDIKTDKFKVNGCQSEVWVHPTFENGKLFFSIDGEAAIVKGILYILNTIYSDSTPTEILSIQDKFLTDSGLIANLSMTRSNGIAQVIKQIKMYALAYQALEKR